MPACVPPKVLWTPPQPGSPLPSRISPQGGLELPKGDGRVEISLCPDRSSCLQKMAAGIIFFLLGHPPPPPLFYPVLCGDEAGVIQESLLTLLKHLLVTPWDLGN